MTTQAFLILTPTEKDAALALNPSAPGLARVAPQEIVNAMADNLGEGVLVGKFVLPARLLNDPAYEAWYDMCGELPVRVFDSEVLFAPPEEP